MTTRFSASVAGRLMACHASANLDLAIPNWVPPAPGASTKAASHGTDVHEIFEKVWELPASEVRAFAKGVQYVADIRSKRKFKVLIEEEVEAGWLDSKPKTKVDLVLYTQDEMHVIDTKWGTIEVSVHDNEQLMYYALAFSPLAPKAKGVWCHIVQPRIDNMEAVFVTTTELMKFRDDTIKAEKAIAAKDLTFGPSDHCKFCPANPHSRGEKGKPLCPAMMQLLYPAPFDEAEILGS